MNVSSSTDARNRELRSHLEHDLADVCAGLHQAVRFGSIGQRKNPVDDRLELLRFEQWPHLVAQALRNLSLAYGRARAQRRAGDRQALHYDCRQSSVTLPLRLAVSAQLSVAALQLVSLANASEPSRAAVKAEDVRSSMSLPFGDRIVPSDVTFLSHRNVGDSPDFRRCASSP